MVEGGRLRITAQVALTFDSARTAAAVAGATAVDNPREGVRQHQEGRTVRFEADPAAPRSLRQTLDDWLRCATVAAEAARRE